MDNKLAIVVIAFNRLKSLERLLKSLNKLKIDSNEKITLYISIDRATKDDKENQKVVEYAKKFEWTLGEKIINYRDKNMGLKKHILECGKLTEIYQNIIVLEDDIIVSPLMYEYAKQVIRFYKNEDRIAGFGLYSFQRNPANNLPFYPLNNGTDIYFMQYACSWGQIWTRDRWEEFYNWYLENKNKDFSSDPRIPTNVKKWGEKSWLKYHVIYTILKDKYFVYPQIGFTSNFTEKGTHNKQNSIAYQCNVCTNNYDRIEFRFLKLEEANNKYDAFFENAQINKILKDEKIIVDFYGEKNNNGLVGGKGHLLTTKVLNYEVIDNYSLQMYPYELNIINNIKGNDIFIYNLEKKSKNKPKSQNEYLLQYLYRLDLLSKKDMLYIMKYFFCNIKGRVVRKIKRIIYGK